MPKVKSSKLAIYLGVTREAEEYNRVGVNSESLTINFNPTETSYADVTMDVEQTDLDSYKVTIEGSGKFEVGDPVYELFKKLGRKQLVLDDAKFPLLLVYRDDLGEDEADLYEDTTVVVNNLTLNGAAPLECDFKLSANTTPKTGKGVTSAADNYRTATFTASSGSDG